MNALLIALFLGFLSAYAQRPTDGTIAIRQDWGQLPEDVSQYDVFVAVPNCDLIGHEGVLQVNDMEYKALVFDCAGGRSHDWMIENGIAAEVDYYFWIQHPELVGTEKKVTIKIFNKN